MNAMAVPNFDGEDLENLIGLYKAGWDSQRLAVHFDLAESTVIVLLDADRRVRLRPEPPPAAEPEPPPTGRGSRRGRAHWRGVRHYERPPPAASGEGLPTFAHHDEHVAAVMAEGGFAAMTERWTGSRWALGLPLLYPAPLAEAAP